MKKAYLYAAISVFMWSTTAALTKLLLTDITSMQITAITAVIAFVFLFFGNLFRGVKKENLAVKIKENLSQWKCYSFWDYLQMSLIGGLGIYVYHILLYRGIDKLTASQAQIINYLWPMLCVIFAALILKEKLTVKKIIAIILSFIGVAIVATNGDLTSFKGGDLTGSILCFLAAVSYSLFSVLNKHKGYDKNFSMMIYYLSASVISIVVTIITKDYFTLNTVQFAGMVWLGAGTNAIAFTTWAIALAVGDTAKISNLAYLTPFVSLVWNFILLGESLSPVAFLGLGFMIAGIILQIYNKPKNKTA